MSPVRLNGSTSGYSELSAPAVAGDQTFSLPLAGGTLDRLNRAGNILQVVNATYSTQATSSSSTYADTGLTATITPTSASSKILVFVSQSGIYKDTANTYLKLRLVRGATELIMIDDVAGYTGSSAAVGIGGVSATYLDSPATTSATTYKTQFASSLNVAKVQIQTSLSTSTITLMEVAA